MKRGFLGVLLVLTALGLNAQTYTLQAGAYSTKGSMGSQEGAVYTQYLLGEVARDAEIVYENQKYKIWFRNLSVTQAQQKATQLQVAAQKTGLLWLINDMAILYKKVYQGSNDVLLTPQTPNTPNDAIFDNPYHPTYEVPSSPR